MPDLRVLVVADDPLARAGLAAMLAAQPGCDVVGQVSSEADLAAEVAVYRPDALLWDLGWDPALPSSQPGKPGGTGRARRGPAARRGAGSRGLDRRRAGPAAARRAAAEALVAALHAAAEGLAVLDPALAGAVLPAREAPSDLLVEELTPRELEVLQLLAEGLSNRGIGQRLGISEHTVKFHVNAIMGKLGAQSRTEAVVRATRLGLIIL